MTTVRALKQKLVEKEKKIKNLIDENDQLRGKLADASHQIENLKNDKATAETHIDELKFQISHHQTKHESLKEILGNLERRCNHKKKEFFTKTADFQCDNCHESQSRGVQMFGCRTCNFDYCQKCGGAADRRVYHVDRHSKKPWGVAVDFEESPIDRWTITRIENGGQFHEKGIGVGWRIHKVNRYRMEELNRGKLENILKNGKKCIIEFDIASNSNAMLANKAREREDQNLHLAVGKVQLAGTWYPAAIASSQMATILDSSDAISDDVVGRVIRNLRPSLVSYNRGPAINGDGSRPNLSGGSQNALRSKRSGWTVASKSDMYASGTEAAPSDSRRMYLNHIKKKTNDDAATGSFFTDSVVSDAVSQQSVSFGDRLEGKSNTLHRTQQILNRKSIAHPGPLAKKRRNH